jgi:hypothetical protein
MAGGDPHVRVEGQRLTYGGSEKIKEWLIADEQSMEHWRMVRLC